MRNTSECFRRGVTLLFTLMALVVLTAIITQFQVDASLQLRSGSYRREMLQCRYAAESAVIGSSLLIKELREKEIAEAGGAASGEVPADMNQNPNQDPNQTPNQDPNHDPNQTPVQNQPASEPNIPFVMLEHTLKVGQADVEISIYDDNARWPMLWLLQSPYGDAAAQNQKIQQSFIDYLQTACAVDADVSRKALELLSGLRNQLRLPTEDLRLEVPEETPNAKAPADTPAQSPRTYRAINKTEDERKTDEKKRRKEMGSFAQSWYQTLHSDPDYRDLITPRSGQESEPNLVPGDYLGLWGSYRVNINTASAELLTAVFAPMGMTAPMAQAMVAFRQQTSFVTPADLAKVPGLDGNVTDVIKPLCVTRSDTFSLRVKARIGRAHYTMIAGLYIDRNQLNTIAAFPGD